MLSETVKGGGRALAGNDNRDRQRIVSGL